MDGAAEARSVYFSSLMKTPILAITMGDPGGIGPEIILKTFHQQKLNPRTSYVIFGSLAPFKKMLVRFRPRLPFEILPAWNPKLLKPGRLFFVNTTSESGFDPGRVSKRNAHLAFLALEAAAKAAVAGEVQAIVTAPIHKTAMRLMDRKFLGHTEYLAAAAKVKSFAMMFVSKRLKVTLVTIHVPIKKVSELITRDRVFEKIRLTHEFLKKYFPLKHPKMAVTALNPHGKETGTEDEAEIRPAVEKAQKSGIHAVGPLSADQLFYDAYEGRFDAVVSMYHDQALGPFKMIAFKEGVNVTLGLPFIRTSPDHGTAFDIAYKGKADPSSFLSALRLAEQLVHREKQGRRRKKREEKGFHEE